MENKFFTSYNSKSERTLVLEAVKQDGIALEYANEIFKNDREIVLEAVKQKGWVLEYANINLKIR